MFFNNLFFMQAQNTTNNNSDLNQPNQEVAPISQEPNRNKFQNILLKFGVCNALSTIVFGLVKVTCDITKLVPSPPQFQNLTTKNETIAFEEFFNKKVDENNNCQIEGAIISLAALTAIGAGFLLLKKSGLSCLSNQTIARNNSNIDADLIVAHGGGERNGRGGIIIADVFDDHGSSPISSPRNPSRANLPTNLVSV